MDTTSTHAGILKSTQDDKSESKSFVGQRVNVNFGGSEIKATKSAADLDSKAQGENQEKEDALSKMTIEDI